VLIHLFSAGLRGGITACCVILRGLRHAAVIPIRRIPTRRKDDAGGIGPAKKIQPLQASLRGGGITASRRDTHSGDPGTEERRCRGHRTGQKKSRPYKQACGAGIFWPGELCSPFLRAESEGFEPPVQSPVHRISSAARSTTLATFRVERKSTLFL
jgi:hypothetical protein